MSVKTSKPFHLLIKPTGPACNLACTYCYCLPRAAASPASAFRMDDATLETVTAAYLDAHPGPEVVFHWHGGEPLLVGLDFYRRALALQARYARPGQRIVNALQTNGTLLDDAWADFFVEHRFRVGISLDGPAYLHDQYRTDRGGRGSHARALAGLTCLQRHQVAYHALVTVHTGNVDHPMRVYRFLTNLGVEHLHFSPVVEREARTGRKVTPWTVRAEPYGAFLCTIFDHWARHDVGRVFVQLFESALNVCLGGASSLCAFTSACGNELAVEHNGDLYACDHYVYRDCKRGAVTSETLAALVEGSAQRAFGGEKGNLCGECRRCPVLPLCGGDCPKHRLRLAPDGKNISCLCAGYREFFTHSAPVLQAMAGEIRAGRPAANVMAMLRQVAKDEVGTGIR